MLLFFLVVSTMRNKIVPPSSSVLPTLVFECFNTKIKHFGFDWVFETEMWLLQKKTLLNLTALIFGASYARFM